MSTLCSLASLRARRTNKAYHARPRALPVVLHRCPNICLRYLELRSQGGYGALCMSCVIPWHLVPGCVDSDAAAALPMCRGTDLEEAL